MAVLTYSAVRHQLKNTSGFTVCDEGAAWHHTMTFTLSGAR